jgi:adenosine deaminase
MKKRKPKTGLAPPRPIWARLVTVVTVVILAGAALLAVHWDSTVTAAAFADARGNQTMLRNFLYRMPKGGDLHVHLSGGVYAERYIAWAVADRLCVRVSDDAIVNRPVDKDENTLPCDRAAGMLPIEEAVGEVDTPARQKTYDRIVNALSMRDFRPTAAEPTGHDHFFAAFGKFSAAAGPHFADMIVDLLASYGVQSAQYVELMTSFSGFSEREKFVQAITGKADYKSKLDALNATGLTAFIAQKKKELDDATAEVDKKRDCDPQKTKPGCMVNYRFIAQVSRNGTLDDVFVQTAIAAAMVRADPMVVAFNYVQAEDAAVARADYSEHMRIAAYLAGNPPGAKRVNVTLHAGELWLGLVPPGDLTFHIYEAVTVAGAQRIGHSVDLAFENRLDELLQTMRQKKVAVEINLTSNDQILGVRGDQHPFPAYRAAGVPVVLSTDDAAVERIDLTNEYVRAARDYDLDYATLKAIARASLTYSFLDEAGKQNELKRFDASSAAFEHAMAARASLLADLCLIVKAEFGRR